METKKIVIGMWNSRNEFENVEFEMKKMNSMWEFTKLVAEAKAMSTNEFELSFNLGKKLFPKMLVSPVFSTIPVEKGEGIKWDLETQIKEFFYNDPQAMSDVITNLMGFMKRERPTT